MTATKPVPPAQGDLALPAATRAPAPHAGREFDATLAAAARSESRPQVAAVRAEARPASAGSGSVCQR